MSHSNPRSQISLRLALLVCLLGGCTTITPEQKVYPSGWPELAAAAQRQCDPPTGTFENTHWLEHFEYPESSGPRTPAPRLSSVLGVSSVGQPVTHIRLQKLENGDLQIESLGVAEGSETILRTRVIPGVDFRCQDKRWFISTTATHEGFRSYQQDDFDPLYSAMYYVGTLGLGAPISSWWNFVFALTQEGSLILRRQNMSSAVLLVMFYSRLAMDDDWFLYRPTDIGKMIARADGNPEFNVMVSPAQSAPLPAQPAMDACISLLKLPSSALFEYGKAFFAHRDYPESLQCFTAAAEHPAGGNREAMWQLCTMYELGLGVETDMEVARQWCQRAKS
ncbi:MAG: hypothetical protein R3E82_07090 [Pseudomonadales bacterium]